ncbi:MAG: oligosaccharide flippase family protein [Myxococcales bacterium]|nr:oligosaccharide flippase family protein [Myxococcales bacterium]
MSDVARSTGRGFLLIIGAKAWFLVSGALISLGMPALFAKFSSTGSGTAEFGVWGVVINLVSVFNMMMITGTLQAVAKLVSEQPEHSNRIAIAALKIQLFIGVPVGAAYILLAPLTASALNDPNLVPLLRISGAIILLYSFYAIFVGYLNGRKQFGTQAGLDILFATLKTALVLGAVVVGAGVLGAVAGFVATAAILTCLAGLVVWKRGKAEAQSREPIQGIALKLLRYMILVMGYTFALNVIIRIDLLFVKSLAGQGDLLEVFVGAGAGTDTLANRLAGVYSAMTNVARLPYQAVIAITFVIFPLVSKATFEGDKSAARQYISQTLRYSLLMVAGMVTVLVAVRVPLVFALFPIEYAAGADALIWLAAAMLAFALMYVGTTILISAGRPGSSLIVSFVTLALAVGLNYALLHGIEPGWPMLERAGSATFAAIGGGALITLGLIAYHYRTSIPLGTAIRCVLSAAVIIGLCEFTVIGDLSPNFGGRLLKLGLVGLKMAILGILFYALLYVMRELSDADRARLRSVFRRGK